MAESLNRSTIDLEPEDSLPRHVDLKVSGRPRWRASPEADFRPSDVPRHEQSIRYITGRKRAEGGNELLAGEMSHRVKNLLAIAAALTKITSRSSRSAAEMSKQLTQRLMALGRADDLVRPVPGNQGTAALLGDVLAVLLAPTTMNARWLAGSGWLCRAWASAKRRPQAWR
jgi:hypothetical protein